VKLLGSITEGSGNVNEDDLGLVIVDDEVTAAWVLDGVTGINGRNYLDAPSDAAWFVQRANAHLNRLAAGKLALPDILSRLVFALKLEWSKASHGLTLPEDHDRPATCLLLVKRYADGWKALRLGDSLLLTEDDELRPWQRPHADLNGLEAELRRGSQRMREAGTASFDSLLQSFHAEHLASRRRRNTPGHHSILVADETSLAVPEFLDLAWPRSILLCTDGFYRAVDTYHCMDDAGLMEACRLPDGVDAVVRRIREAEASDPDCATYPRYKPADDATAIMIGRDIR
jgi:serine/threonine protein phosphatase PrpC